MNSSTAIDSDSSRLLQLDGLRGVLVLSIVVAHVQLSLFPGALILMDVFFVLSGFLITRVLHRNLLYSGSLKIKEFWIRRFLRLAPALYLMLFVYFIAVSWLQGDITNTLKDTLIAGSYTTNWFKANDFFTPYYLGHTWSLATEEQFYLLWPLFLLGLFGLGLRINRIWLTLLGLAALVQLWRWYLISQEASITRLYHALDVRLDGFFIGGAVYFCLLGNTRAFLFSNGWISFSVIAITICLVKGLNTDIFVWMQPAVIWSSFFLLGSLASQPESHLSFFFRQPFFVFLGKICYSLYLWHFPLLKLSEKYWQISPWVRVPSALLLIGIASVASYYWVELPLLKRKSTGGASEKQKLSLQKFEQTEHRVISKNH